MAKDLTKHDLLKDEWPYSIKFHEFATFLGLSSDKDAKGVNWRYDKKTAKKIEELYIWGKRKTGSEDPLDIMIAVKQLNRDLGITFRGKKLVDHLWGYTQLDTKTISLDEAREKVEKEKSLYVEKEENGD